MDTPPSAGSRTGHIFVSYSRKDLEWVRRLVTDLERANLPVWLDVHKLQPGEVWDTEIEQALQGTDILIVVLSDDSAKSRNVLDEINYALSKDRLVVPVLYRACEIPYRVARLQHVDFSTSYESALHHLIERLSAARGHAAPAPAISPASGGQADGTPAKDQGVAGAVAPARREGGRSGRMAAMAGGLVLAACVVGLALWVFLGRERGAPDASGPLQGSTAADAGVSASATPPNQGSGAPPEEVVAQGSDVAPPAAEPERAPERTRRPAPDLAPSQAAAGPSQPSSRSATPAAPAPPAGGSTRPAPSATGTPDSNRAITVSETPPPVSSPSRGRLQPQQAEEARSDAAPGTARRPAADPGPPTPSPTAPLAVRASAEHATPAPASGVEVPEAASPAGAKSEESAVRRVIELYAQALNAKNASLLTQVRPSLSRGEAESLLKAMPANHTTTFGDVTVRVDGPSASVRLTRQDRVKDASEPMQTRLLVTLGQQNGDWIIERIQRER